MIRRITHKPPPPPPPPPPKEEPTAAQQISRLEAEATELRKQIRMANKMGEVDAAAQARQRLTEVNAELDTLKPPPAQTAAPTAKPTVAIQPNGEQNPVPTDNQTAIPFAQPALAGTDDPTVVPLQFDLTVSSPPATPIDDSPIAASPQETSAANDIVSDVTEGKSINQIAQERGMTRDEVIGALRAGDMQVTTTAPTSDNGDVQTTEILDPATGRSVTEYYDYQHDNYHTQIADGGQETTSPMRDGSGRQVSSDYNSETGVITTRYVDDLGSGATTEEVSLPNGTRVETATPGTGAALPVTTVSHDGQETVLAPSQDAGGGNLGEIQEQLAEGKSIDQVAQERGVSPDQLIAELEASGLDVTTRAPESDNGDVQSVELVDPHTGDKTVYHHDYQHDERTVVTTSGSTETTVSEDGNGGTRRTERNLETGESTTTIVDGRTGTETEIVVDADGRTTKTTTEKINGGEPVTYDVKPGDNLTEIAEQNGVTLDQLRETNPELFEGRDPDLIHPGEQVTIEDGTRTTVEVTFNGYTLTTKPDGSITLHDDVHGTDVEIERGSPQESIAEALIAANPNSSNAEEAKEGEIIVTFANEVFAGEALPGLIEEATTLRNEKDEAIEAYGLGTPATPTMDGENRIVDPFGEPPAGDAPSGGKWTPMKIDGVWRWVDPEVATAIANESVALSSITELQSRINQNQAQTDVYALDPAYGNAMEGATSTLNEALAPHGLQWSPVKPEGTLAEAQERLTTANTMVENAQEAHSEYVTAADTLENAIDELAQLTPIIDPDAEYVTAAGGSPGPSREEQYAQGVADHAAVDALFSEVGLHLSRGDKLTIDYLVGEAEFNGIPNAEEYAELKEYQSIAADQLELAEAYHGYFSVHADATQMDVQSINLQQRLLMEHLDRKQYEPEKKYNRMNGDYLGTYQTSTIELRDGQVWIIDHFEEGTTETQVTYANTENVRDEFFDRPLNLEWQEFLTGNDPNVCVPNQLQDVRAQEAQAAQNLNDVLDRQLGEGITNIDDALSELQTNYDGLLAERGPGTLEAPEGTLADGEQPVEITVGDQTIKVAPDVAQQYEEGGLAALAASGKAIWIDLDGAEGDLHEARWVDPELALARLELNEAREQAPQQKEDLENLREQVQGFADWHELRASDPSLLLEENSGVDSAYLEEHEQQALDGIYQPQFQALYDIGYDNKFRQQVGQALEDNVAQTLGLDPTSSEGRDTLETVTEEIRDIGGENPYIRNVPLFYVDDEVGTQQVALIAVRDGDGNTRYVDITGKKFDDLNDFQDNNSQFGDQGRLVAPKNLEMSPGADGRFELETIQSREYSAWDKVVDPIVGITTAVATIASFTPLAPIAAPIAYGGAAYLGTRAAIRQANHLEHGGEWTDGESIMNMASVATTVLPVASSGLRTIGMASSLRGAPRAFAGTIGATRPTSALAAETRAYMQSSARLNRVAYGMDVGAMVVGTPLLATSAYDLVVNGDQMNGLELANAIAGLTSGIAGTGLGARGLYQLRPGTGQSGSTRPGADGPGTNIHGDGPGGGQPPRPALPAGPDQPPMRLYEAGSDGVYRPTDELVHHSSDRPVIPGEVVSSRVAHDEGGSPQPDQSARPPRETDGTADEGTHQRAGDDPIIVVPPITPEDSGPTRLIWDPVNQTFSGMPERNPSEYTYTSGKDERPPSVYLDEELSKLSPEELAAQYERESRYYSSYEMMERYGPHGVVMPERSIQDMLPDLRIGMSFRMRLYGGDVGIGSPTLAAVGFGIGTKTDYGAIFWSVADSVSQRSIAPLKDALITSGSISIRPKEYRNITALQAGVWPVSNQLAFPIRASDLSKVASRSLFTSESGFDVKLRSGKIIGTTPDGSAMVVEVVYTPAVRAEELTPAAGDYDFMGVPASQGDKFFRLEGDLPYDRVMTEGKFGLRNPTLAQHSTTIAALPRIGGEMRPESTIKDGPRKGDLLIREHYDQVQSSLASIKLKIQLAVADPTKAHQLVAAVERGDVGAIRSLAEQGVIDPAQALSLVDGPSRSGLRLSAVPNKTPHRYIRSLTGELIRTPNLGAMLVDIPFNVSSPDRMLTSALYNLKNKIRSTFRQDGGTPFQPRYMPHGRDVYGNLYGSYARPATRFTGSLATPPLPLGPIAFSAEIRLQYKTDPKKPAAPIAKNRTTEMSFIREGERVVLDVPVWLADVAQTASQRSPMIIPKGGKKSLKQFLDQLESSAGPEQRAQIQQFRDDYGKVVSDGMFLRTEPAKGVLEFLASQARPPLDPPRSAPQERPAAYSGSGERGAPVQPGETTGVRPLSEAEIVANRREATQLFNDMVAQDLRIPEMSVTDLADQFSRSPTLMGLLRNAHAQGVRIVNVARPDLQVQAPRGHGHDMNVKGASYQPNLRLITLDADMLRPAGRILSRDVIVAEHVRLLAHELSHVTDVPANPRPANYSDESGFVEAFVSANLQDEGRAKLIEFQAATEMEANGGRFPKTLRAPVNEAELSVYERFVSGEADEATAVRELSQLFGDKPRSTDPNYTYNRHYTRLAQAIWDRTASPGASSGTTTAPLMQSPSAAPNVSPQSLGGAPGVSNNGPRLVGAAPDAPPLTRNEVRAVPASQARSFDFTTFSGSQIRWLTQAQVRNLSKQQLLDISRSGLHAHLSKPQLQAIPATKIIHLDVSGLNGRQVPWLKISQVAKLTGRQWRDLGSAGLLPHVTKKQLQAVPHTKVAHLDIGALEARQVPWFTSAQAGRLTKPQLQAIGEAGFTPRLTKAQLSAIAATKIPALAVDGLAARQVPWLTKKQMAALSDRQLQDLTAAGHHALLTGDQLAAIPPVKIGSLGIVGLQDGQFPSFLPSQVARFSEQQWRDIGAGDKLKLFGETQIKAISRTSIAHVDLSGLAVRQVPWLTVKQIPGLSSTQLGGLTIRHIEAFTRPQIEALTPEQLGALSPRQFRNFTAEQFEWMSPIQTNALSVHQLTTFQAAHRKTMTPAQAAAVKQALGNARFRETAQAIATFGPMSTSSYMLWSALPPHISATVGGVALGVRGTVFSLQSMFPNAAAADKPFGRALNFASGASFILSSPGSTAPFLQSFDNPVVNGSFTLGNVVFGTKSALQGFTGRAVMRNAAEYLAGPGYVIGSLVYTIQSWPSPLPATAGALFTAGSIEFLASAYRTDRSNRRPPPRTDDAIAAEKKADARWATADRIALGLTFGVGMFLFAWDALDDQPWNGTEKAPGPEPESPDGAATPKAGADEPDPAPEAETTPEPEEFPQLVVLPDDGLNLRAQPDPGTDRIAALEPGTFVQQTDAASDGQSGEDWVPVEGYDAGGQVRDGWVSGAFVRPHPEGARNAAGRINPRLEESGYPWVEVRDGNTIRTIAQMNAVEVAETVVLNMDHILDPEIIFEGDRIYLPTVPVG